MEIKHIESHKTCDVQIFILDNNQNAPATFPEDLTKLKEKLTDDVNQVCLLGLDKDVFLVKGGLSKEEYRKEGSKISDQVKNLDKSISCYGTEEHVLGLLEGLALASYKFDKYFTDEKKRKKRKELHADLNVSKENLSELNNMVKAVFWARDMVNEPLSYLTAEKLSDEIKALDSIENLKVTVLEKAQIEALKMGGLLAVNKGSIDPPTFTIVEYKPENATNKKPIVLVGKGVVYDTGGLSLKPTAGSMDVMKSDMGGAACVIGAIQLAATQKLNKHIIALVPATDNRPGLNAYVPGDVINMHNGMTVEVLNTDAEGRMILADALSYSSKFEPELVIDAATLTGAALRAIGHHAAIIMGNADQQYFDQLVTSGVETHDRVFQFPFWSEYGEEMKSSIADLKNIGGANAGMISAGKFLEHFVKAPYIHMDIAGPAWLDSDMDYKKKGGTGAGVKLLYHFLKNLK